ncbi:hypothetical protein ARALYDRAFT_919501 [Arabidopsis lyrata subsp. lyrata]|uniref:Uncharacterized protein n=1 Tax=Arabidopsis lyrata subsp. lyrata TaxID=81972 RepID=D7MLW1_ARALL|nr:hypothetical protein ARALYDRAFT_919501 [Arabidopsis lyrata subsp. lyrata]
MIPLQVCPLQKIHDESLAELKLIHARMRECDTHVSGFVTEQEKCLQKLSYMKLERKKLENELLSVSVILSCLGFEKATSHACFFVTTSLLEKRVNKKVMAMFEKAEDEYNALISKKNTTEKEKLTRKVIAMFEKAEDEYNALVSKKNYLRGGPFLKATDGDGWRSLISETSVSIWLEVGSQSRLIAVSRPIIRTIDCKKIQDIPVQYIA